MNTEEKHQKYVMKGSYAVTIAYLKPKQLNALQKLREQAKDEHQVSLSVASMIRYAVDDFLEATNNKGNGLKAFLEYRGW
jgi:hypothetical protein